MNNRTHHPVIDRLVLEKRKKEEIEKKSALNDMSAIYGFRQQNRCRLLFAKHITRARHGQLSSCKLLRSIDAAQLCRGQLPSSWEEHAKRGRTSNSASIEFSFYLQVALRTHQRPMLHSMPAFRHGTMRIFLRLPFYDILFD